MVACILLIFCACAIAEERTASPLEPAAVDALIHQHVKDKGLVGVSVAIMREGQIVFAKGYGQRSLDPPLPVEPETCFAVASVTKQFTCACILLLAEERKLAVTDPVSKYFPHLTRAADITLLDLMQHTSGYPDYYPLDFIDRRMLRPIAFDQLLKDYAGGKLDFEPGSRYSYSNTGYIVLGGVVEKVTGQKFGDFLSERILKPLGMEHSRFGEPSGLTSVAAGYNAFALDPPGPAPREAAGWIDAAGGLWASAPDLLKWDLALAGGKVLRPETFEKMIAPRKLASGKISSYGCGLRSEIRDGDLILSHTGGVSGFASYNGFLPRTRSGLVVLSNSEHVSSVPLRNLLLDLVIKDIAAKETPPAPKITGPEPKDLIGRFFRDLQSGQIDRTKLSEEFNIYMTDDRVKSGGARLKELGEPLSVSISAPPGERGGMEVVQAELKFKTASLRASLYRTPDGQIQQLIFTRE
jgi:CubicO group peptidase (beta-lactamase class C family)